MGAWIAQSFTILHMSPQLLFSDVFFLCMQYFSAGFAYMRVNFYIFVYLEQGLSREELCCSEMMQLFVIVLAMNEISLII